MKVQKIFLMIILGIVLFCLNGCDFLKSKEIKNAETCIQLQQHNEALKHLEKEIKNHPDNAYAYLLQGKILIKLQKNQKAIESFKYSLKLKKEYKQEISLFYIETAKEKIKLKKLPTKQIQFLLEQAVKIDPQKIEIQKEILKEFAMLRLNKFSDIQNGSVFLIQLCNLDKKYEKFTGDILYEFGQQESGDKKIIAFVNALKYDQKHKQEIISFLIKKAKENYNASLYRVASQACQKGKNISLDQELFQAKKTITNRLIFHMEHPGRSIFRDIKKSRENYINLQLVNDPIVPYKNFYIRIKENEKKSLKISPYTLSQRLRCDNFKKYIIKTDQPIYIIFLDKFGVKKIEKIKSKYTLWRHFSNSERIIFLSLSKKTNIILTKKN